MLLQAVAGEAFLGSSKFTEPFPYVHAVKTLFGISLNLAHPSAIVVIKK